jgi:hypothetical protein
MIQSFILEKNDASCHGEPHDDGLLKIWHEFQLPVLSNESSKQLQLPLLDSFVEDD